MTWEASSPLENGSPGSRSEITIWDVLVRSLIRWPLSGFAPPRHPPGDRQVDDLSRRRLPDPSIPRPLPLGCPRRPHRPRATAACRHATSTAAAFSSVRSTSYPPAVSRSSARPARSASLALDPTIRTPYAVSRCCAWRCGDRGRGGGCEERVLSPHICQRHWEEVGHHDPRIAERTSEVSGELGEVLGPGNRACSPW